MRLQFREGHLDRVQVRAVGGQEQEPGALVPEDAGCLGALMDRQVIEDDDVTGRQRRSELRLDPQVEGGAVHRLVDDPWRGEPVAAQAGGQSAPTSRAATQPHHLGGDGGLVDEHEPGRLIAHPPLARTDPATARLSHVGAFALRGHQGFFICERMPAQEARQGGRRGADAVRLDQPVAEFRHGDVGLGLDSADQESGVGRQLAGARRPSLAVRLARARHRDPMHQPDRGAVTHGKVPGGGAARVARRDQGYDTLAKING